MDPKISPTRPDMVTIMSEPRPTPKPNRARFAEVLADGAVSLVRGAEAVMTQLPGAPLMAAALRGGGSSAGLQSSSLNLPFGSGAALSAAEGPGATTTGSGGITGVSGAGASGASGGGSIEASLAQSQEMNLYFLQIQEAVNAQNRTYSALSNVLKTEHDTVKNAIGNLR